MSKIIADPRIDTMIITVKDITAVGHCVRGTRQWFERYGFDFRHVVKHGVPARELLALNDAHANAVVMAKLKRMG